MKKLLVFVLILVCITALASCGGENGDNNQNGGSNYYIFHFEINAAVQSNL